MNNISTHPYFWRVFLFLALLLGFSHHAMAEFVRHNQLFMYQLTLFFRKLIETGEKEGRGPGTILRYFILADLGD